MRALNLLRTALHYRRDSFDRGLRAAGFDVVNSIPDPRPDDVLAIWNRYSSFHEEANRFESAGARVVVTENGPLGKTWRGGNWYSLSIGDHNGAGQWRVGGHERWDSLGVELAPWKSGTEIVILGQRGIGSPKAACPKDWAERMKQKTGGRIRPHPGKDKPRVSLEDDLRNAKCVAVWHSGAALAALALGTPAFYAFPQWWGAQAAKPVAALLDGKAPLMCDVARLAMFRKLAWCQWQRDEIADGSAFKWLLHGE